MVLSSPISDFRLHAFVDANYVLSLDDRCSTSGFCVIISCNILLWCSKKQHVVPRSSTEAEYRSLDLASTDVLWIASLFTELGFPLVSPSVLWCDNQGAIILAFNLSFHFHAKHIELDMHFIQEQVQNQVLDVRYIPTKDQPTDLFNKPLSPRGLAFYVIKLVSSSNFPLLLREHVRILVR